MRLLFVLLLVLSTAPALAASPLDRLTLPKGFHIAVYTDQVPCGWMAPGARLTNPFITGFEQDEQSWGRPVEVQPLPDGSLLVGDDQAGAVYRVTYGRRRVLLPLPVSIRDGGKGQGAGRGPREAFSYELQKNTRLRGSVARATPHPNPLPAGEREPNPIRGEFHATAQQRL